MFSEADRALIPNTAETKGRTYAELDILFENRVPARRFASTRIETLVEGTEDAQKQQIERRMGHRNGEE